MDGLTLFYTIVVILVMVAAVLYWMMSGRSRQNSTVWLIALGITAVIGLGAVLFGVASGWNFSGKAPENTSLVQPKDPASSDSGTNSPSSGSGNSWADLKRLAPGLLPDCFQNAGLNKEWGFITTSDANKNSDSLVIAFVLLTAQTAQKYQRACKEPNLGTPKENEAYVAMFAQSQQGPAQIELSFITFSQDEKSYNVTEYLTDEQRSESERWVTQDAPWLPIVGNFPSATNLLAELVQGKEGRSVGIIALPTGAMHDGKASLLDPTRSFQVRYANKTIQLLKP